jgi:hypothetical protein
MDESATGYVSDVRGTEARSPKSDGEPATASGPHLLIGNPFMRLIDSPY